MIQGQVNAFREAIVPLRLLGATGVVRDIEAALDTGFTDFLTLPNDLIAVLGFPQRDSVAVTLADNSETYMRVYAATILWDGATRRVLVYATEGGSPLIGMGLVYGHRIVLDAVDGGTLEITPLTTPA